MSVSDFINNLLDLALIPFTDSPLFLYCAGLLCVAQLFRITHRLMNM